MLYHTVKEAMIMDRTNKYALAIGLKGFKDRDGQPVEMLRVKITREEGEYCWVMTADLRDAGTSLVLNTSQVLGVL